MNKEAIKFSGKVFHVTNDMDILDKNKNTQTKRGYAIKTNDEYPKTVYFEIYGKDKIEKENIQVGDELEAYVNISSREYMGKYYTSIVAWKINNKTKRERANQGEEGVMPKPNSAPTTASQPTKPATSYDDLPF